MKTACGLTYSGPGRIAICRWARGFPAGFRMYKPLAPGEWFNKVEYPEYYRRYRNQLGKLDPERVLKELKALAAPHEPVLLCWERPPLHRDNWCHRSIVARWFWETLGLEVRERYHGKHRSWNWRKLPPFTTGPDWNKSQRSRQPARGAESSEARL
jgi:Protein of unknown function, DUF488